VRNRFWKTLIEFFIFSPEWTFLSFPNSDPQGARYALLDHHGPA
jgi:hypothetical protein